MIESRYRRDYDGEFVITETRVADGTTQQTREWVPNAIENHHISGRAAVIGSRTDHDIPVSATAATSWRTTGQEKAADLWYW